MLIISGLNIAFDVASPIYVILGVIWCVVILFALDGLFAIIVRFLPNKWFLPDNPAFNVSNFERKLYRKIKVRRWKDKVWELGGLGGFSKSRVEEPNNPKYIERFIIECNKGVLTHRLAYLPSFLVMLTFFNRCAFTIALPAALVNIFLSILPTIVLRYNTPMLKSVLARLKRREAKEAERALSDGCESVMETEKETVSV